MRVASVVKQQQQEGKMMPQELVLHRAQTLHNAASTLRQHATLGLTDPAGKEAIKFYEGELARIVQRYGLEVA